MQSEQCSQLLGDQTTRRRRLDSAHVPSLTHSLYPTSPHLSSTNKHTPQSIRPSELTASNFSIRFFLLLTYFSIFPN
jgi:hypothetical protein